MYQPLKPTLVSSPLITRHPANPLLRATDLPYPSDLVFNAGITKYEGRYVMVFRNDYGYADGKFAGTNLGLATSADGIRWEVAPEPVWSIRTAEISRVYDPRLTVIDGVCYLCFAMDTRHGVRGGIARTDDFANFEILSLSVPDNRNMVLFPELIGGKYVRLERPFPVYGRERAQFDIWLSDSPDLRYWGGESLVLGVEDVPYANDKVGPAAPPVRTKHGWLTSFHAVDIDPTRGKNGWEPFWRKRYCAGIMLLDPDDPSRVIGLCREPLLAPEADYELNGFRGHVIFPGGMILEPDGEVKIYYGGADTVECLATAHVDDLVELCLKGGPVHRET